MPPPSGVTSAGLSRHFDRSTRFCPRACGMLGPIRRRNNGSQVDLRRMLSRKCAIAFGLVVLNCHAAIPETELEVRGDLRSRSPLLRQALRQTLYSQIIAALLQRLINTRCFVRKMLRWITGSRCFESGVTIARKDGRNCSVTGDCRISR
jgi:hypothetical protein